jgi:PAS domain S-box-containing protein
MLVGYSIVIILSISLGSAFIYNFVRRNINASIESELQNSTTAILNMVKTSAAVSIKNHLRAVAEKNLEIVDYFHGQYQKGLLSEENAKAQAAEVMLSQSIGDSGYIYCIDSTGKIVVHPQTALLDTNVSEHAFVRQQLERKKGYIEYDWKNPGETDTRPKALYMTYFPDWDWIISVSSYRKEFKNLVNVDDFRQSVLELKFGDTGYSYVVDGEGNAIIHPQLQGVNILKTKRPSYQFLQEMLDQKTGKLIHIWQNPDESTAREKLVIFNHIPEFQWTVASSCYLEELYAPLSTIRDFTIFTVMVTLLLVLPITFTISSSITRPLQTLMRHFDRVVADDFTQRMKIKSQDEIGQLASVFNRFMDQLQAYNTDLKKQMLERQQAEEALRESEERYRSVMHAAPDPIVVYDMEGRVIYLNPAFTWVFGWTLAECIGKNMDHFVPEKNWSETRAMIATVLSGEAVSSIETLRYTKAGDTV